MIIDRGSVALHQDIGTSTIQPLVAVPDHANSRDTAKYAITGKMHTEYERHVPDPRRLFADLGPQRVADHALECLRLLSPSQKKIEDIWYQFPSELRKVAYGVFPGIHVEIDSIRDESERKTMCRKINELKRERCIMLSSPAQREHWHDETWTNPPPVLGDPPHLAISNPVKWKSTLEYLKKCPETPDRGNPTRCIDASTMESPHRVRAHARSPNMRTSTPQRHPSRHESSPRGLEGLSRMARTPPSPHSPGRGSSQSFRELVRRRVEVDIANLSADDFEITRANRFPRKMKPLGCTAGVASSRLPRSEPSRLRSLSFLPPLSSVLLVTHPLCTSCWLTHAGCRHPSTAASQPAQRRLPCTRTLALPVVKRCV